MNKKIVCAALAAAALAACEKKDVQVPSEEKEMVALEVKVPSAATKVVSAGSEDAVSLYQIFVYSTDDGMLEAYETLAGNETSVTVTCTTGPKEIIVLANAPDLKSVVSLSAMKDTRSKLEHNKVGALVMEGNKVTTLSASSTVEIEMRRLVAKVRLSKIKVDFENDAYDSMSFEIVAAYLINVPADKKYLMTAAATVVAGPADWYNKLAYASNSAYDGILRDEINKSVKDYQTAHVFYSYPNPYQADDFSSTWSARPTRLVVEAKLGSKLYYYPIALPELKQNTVYDVTLDITRPGKVSPIENMTKNDETFTIKVLDWEPGGSYSEVL